MEIERRLVLSFGEALSNKASRKMGINILTFVVEVDSFFSAESPELMGRD